MRLDIPVNAQGFAFEQTIYSFNLHIFTCIHLADTFIQSYLQVRLRSIKAYNQCTKKNRSTKCVKSSNIVFASAKHLTKWWALLTGDSLTSSLYRHRWRVFQDGGSVELLMMCITSSPSYQRHWRQ